MSRFVVFPGGPSQNTPDWYPRVGPVISEPGFAVLESDDYDGKSKRFRFRTEGGVCYPPEPILQEVDLMDAVSLTQWVGQRPYRMDVSVQLDGFPDESVEDEIQTLEHFAEVHAGRAEPPIVTVSGSVPTPHPNLTWRVQRIADPVIDYAPGGRDRCRYFTTVSLVQRVTDRILQESLKRSSKSKGVSARKTTVRAGEEWLFEVARRVYKDPSRAGDIATANGIHVGKKLRVGQELRVP